MAWVLVLWCVRLAVALRSAAAPGEDAALLAASPPEPPPPSDRLTYDEALHALDDLWGGSDSASLDALRRFLPEAPNASAALAERVGPPPKLQLLGMFDSGTNLMWALMLANLGQETMNEVCPTVGEGHCFFWKHTPPQELPPRVSRLRGGGPVVLVSIVRSPLAHIAGWIKAPYNLFQCIRQTNWTDYHERSCHLGSDQGLFSDAAPISEDFNGPTGVWNSYVQGYHSYSERADKDVRVVVVEYERLVIDPEAVVQEVARALGRPLQQPFRGIEAPAKAHGEPHGRQKALQDIEKMEYLQREPMSNSLTKKALCEHLDSATMGRHMVPIAPRERSYAADCE